MPHTTLAGHPLHPQLVALPLGMFPFSLAMDLCYLATGKESFADAAYYSMAGGLITGAAASAAGAADYLTIPRETQSAKTANVHAVVNLSMMGLFGLNLLMRSGRRNPGGLPVLMSLLGNAGLVAGAWYGGKLVYELGMRVKPVMEGAGGPAPELKLPGDRQIEQAFEKLEKTVTSGDGR